MAVCKDKKRGVWYINFKKKIDGAHSKTINIKRAEWTTKEFKKKDTQATEHKMIKNWEVENGLTLSGVFFYLKF